MIEREPGGVRESQDLLGLGLLYLTAGSCLSLFTLQLESYRQLII